MPEEAGGDNNRAVWFRAVCGCLGGIRGAQLTPWHLQDWDLSSQFWGVSEGHSSVDRREVWYHQCQTVLELM